MLDLTLFKRPAMVGVSLAAFTISASIFALFLYLTLYIQDDLGYGPLPAGLRFLPITMLAFIVAPIAGKLTVRVHSRYLLGAGLFLISAGCLLMSTTHPSSGWTVLLPGFIVAGIGIGTVNPVLASSAISVVPPERSGMASGTNNTFRQVGIATGIAGLGTVFQTQIEHHTLAALNATPAGQAVVAHGGAALQGALVGGGVHDALPSIPSEASRQALLQAYRVGFSSTLDHLMVIGAVIAFVGSLASFILVRQRDFVPSYAPPAEGAPAGSPVSGGVVMAVSDPARVADDETRRGPGRPRDQRASTAITEAALRQLNELGYAKVSMESVAGEAGVARATIYRRYRDKADLITAAIASNSSTHLGPAPSRRAPLRPDRLPRSVR